MDGYTPNRFITRNWQCDFGGWLSKFEICDTGKIIAQAD